MALVTTEKMLKDAQAGHYAVGAFNVENLEFVMAVLAAAEETKSPVIMQTTPGTIKTAGLDYFYGMVKAAAERASVPVALHLDQRTTKAGTFLLEHQKVCINLLQRSFILLIKPRFNVIKHDTVPMQLI